MKKVYFWLAILLLIGYGIVQYKLKDEKQSEIDVQVQEAASQKEGRTIQVTKDQIFKGDLLLVNKDHPVPPEGEEPGAVNLSQHPELVKGFSLLDNTIQLSPRLLQNFTSTLRAAEKEGVSHFLITSGYRNDQEQSQLYQQMGAEYAMPAGFSEHNLGLSIDIGSTQGDMNQVPEGEWLSRHAWKYGFILRYPKDKEHITGIRYEPWHFRYVGFPHSAIIQKKGFVLEEYLDFLKEQKTVTATVDHQTYKISYYPVSTNTTIHVPENGRYDISGNNMDGVIVTVHDQPNLN
ncbi:D-Ala-D-Ala carboxypeptidase VanY [Tumebacillus algifaecis]|uniref:D-Ala-D-Ala carboxypeptidase VanY n=1 Tax=Tumebacillus algifaecis TaxID=1214604 RepID=A0A223CYV4_9BACL|nr:M15 family metallopeptidase [Tumebacillus algifaecis]ASS74364.1 D-Ala-D-Ala carboxypeptidase VanY [Tumebacillus algifaecis]